MDFLEIRRKAKERAAGGDAAPEPVVPAPAPAPAADAGLAGGTGPAARELAADLQTLPPAPAEAEPPANPDERFTTWRPGSGQRPDVGPPERELEPSVRPAEVLPPLPPPPRAAEPLPPPLPVAPPAAPPVEPVRRGAPVQPSPPRAPARALDPLDEFFYRADEELLSAVALPAEDAPAAPEVEDAGVEEYLTFLLGAEEYAVAIERVREVLKSPLITEVPRAPAGILGVVTVRGDVVAVFDPRRRLNLPGPTPEPGLGRIVIVDDGEGPCGLLVDTVASVVRLARGSIEPTPQGIGGASADCLAGIGRERNRLFTVLDLSALLRRGAAPRKPRGAHAGA